MNINALCNLQEPTPLSLQRVSVSLRRFTNTEKIRLPQLIHGCKLIWDVSIDTYIDTSVHTSILSEAGWLLFRRVSTLVFSLFRSFSLISRALISFCYVKRGSVITGDTKNMEMQLALRLSSKWMTDCHCQNLIYHRWLLPYEMQINYIKSHSCNLDSQHLPRMLSDLNEAEIKHRFLYRILSCFSLSLHGFFFYGVCSTDRVALLLLGDVLVDVLVTPVKHELLLLPVVHPHDLLGHLLDDLLELLQLLSPTKRHFLARQRKVRFNTWPTVWHEERWADNIFVYFTCKLSHSWSRAWRFPLSPFLI